MVSRIGRLLLACALGAAPVSGFQTARGATADYEWKLPKGFPRPRVPAANPMSEAKAQLGRYLFYDKRMSVNGTQACASCHRQEMAFTNGSPCPSEPPANPIRARP